MKSIFLKLSSFRFGAARRHCPFRSIIHKPICFLFALIFFSLHCFLVPVSALASGPLPFKPVYDTQLYQLPSFVDPLTETQTDIFYFILGSQLVEYAGLSGYQLENPYTDPQSVGDWFKRIGIDLYNDVLGTFVTVGAPVVASAKWLRDLYANIAGAANFAGYFNNTSFYDFLDQVEDEGLSLELYPSMFGALNQFTAEKGGLYLWQKKTMPWVSSLITNEVNLSDTGLASDYLGYLLPPEPLVRRSYASYFYNYAVTAQEFSSYNNLFINTSEHYIYVVNDNGLPYNEFMNLKTAYFTYSNNLYTLYTSPWSISFLRYLSGPYSSSLNPLEVARACFDGTIQFTNSNENYFDNYLISDFISGVYYGDSWSNRSALSNSDDLNFEENSSESALVPIQNTLLDIKGLLSDLLETNDLKAPALNNLNYPDGSPFPVSELQPISVAVELPESGIVVPEGLFGSSKGFIDYLWYMTKPLVQYTHDFVGTMWFDGVDGFDFSGPAPIVFGVITLGLIGGLIVKFLL